MANLDIGEGQSILIHINEECQEVEIEINPDSTERKVFSLSKQRWSRLSSRAPEVSSRLAEDVDSEADHEDCWKEEAIIHLGGPMYLHACATCKTVTIAKCWLSLDGVSPRNGDVSISLTQKEWNNLCDLLHDIAKAMDLCDVVPCYLDEDHQNQLGMLKCAECNPFNFLDWY